MMAVFTGDAAGRNGTTLEDPPLSKISTGTRSRASMFRVLWELPTTSPQAAFCCLRAGLEHLNDRQDAPGGGRSA
jgi:hypothetical protein